MPKYMVLFVNAASAEVEDIYTADEIGKDKLLDQAAPAPLGFDPDGTSKFRIETCGPRSNTDPTCRYVKTPSSYKMVCW